MPNGIRLIINDGKKGLSIAEAYTFLAHHEIEGTLLDWVKANHPTFVFRDPLDGQEKVSSFLLADAIEGKRQFEAGWCQSETATTTAETTQDNEGAASP